MNPSLIPYLNNPVIHHISELYYINHSTIFDSQNHPSSPSNSLLTPLIHSMIVMIG